MLYAKIRLNAKNHEVTPTGLDLFTIFGTVTVDKADVVQESDHTVLIPAHIFAEQGYNPCQMVTGFKGHIIRGGKA